MHRPALSLFALVVTTALAQMPVPANVQVAIKKADAGIARILAIPDRQRNFENTVRVLDDVEDDLNTETVPIVFMAEVSPDATVRDGARAAQEALSDWTIAIKRNEAVYRALQAVPMVGLGPVQRRLLDFYLRDYRRSGMALPPEKRARLTEIERVINKNQQAFDKDIADDESVVTYTAKELEGVPDSRLATFGRSGDLYVVPLSETNYPAIVGYAKDPAAREKYCFAFFRWGGTANVGLLEATLRLRAEQASLMGYANPAAYEDEVRMAKNPETVAAFYARLRPLVRQKARRDYAELIALKRRDVKGAKGLDLWDWDYYRNRLLAEKYAVDSAKVAEYFPSQATFQGMLNVASTLYGIEFRDVTKGATDLWAPDVQKREVWDRTTGKKLGTMYFDLFPRANKYTHAECWPLVGHRVNSDGTVQLPSAALVCNFTPPTADRPSLLPHTEVVTMFHEFGHGLHAILSESPYGRFAGTNVELDFVEAPSQMFQNWVWDPGVLATFAKHYKTGEPLPGKLLKAMVAAKNVDSGLEYEKWELRGIMDQRYHLAPGGVIDTTKAWLDGLNDVTLFSAILGTYPQAAFGHPMDGYQAGYYGYIWSEVYAQDMFQRFRDKGLLSPEAGAYYRAHILAKGGTEDATDLVREYLRREPSQDAFLRDLGLTTPGK